MLSVRDLRVSFFTPAGEVKAVNGISYDLRRGEAMGIVGESGSGKSVGAYSIMGLLQSPGRVIGGSIRLCGENVLEYSSRQMRDMRGKRVSMIFQNPMASLNPVYTIGDQIREALTAHSRASRAYANGRAAKMLDLVGISNPEKRLRQHPHELSGGMRQRVMIALALICEPDLLIADEPTTALDVTIQAQIVALMDSIRKERDMAIIFITHNLGVVADICTRVAVMYAGRIVESGPVNAIFYSPMHPYTRGLLRSMPRVDDDARVRLVPIDGAPADMLNPPPGCPFAPRCAECMNVCLRAYPPTSAFGAGHTSSCWLFERDRALSPARDPTRA
ncbi:MAG: ABC transporter ATP-binding protein [Clostridiales bacterium]|nr:ABC transporter ATP-binding protein [Clostridiales bacterium]